MTTGANEPAARSAPPAIAVSAPMRMNVPFVTAVSTAKAIRARRCGLRHDFLTTLPQRLHSGNCEAAKEGIHVLDGQLHRAVHPPEDESKETTRDELHDAVPTKNSISSNSRLAAGRLAGRVKFA